VRCFSNLASIPEAIDGVVIATHPEVSIEVVRQWRTAASVVCGPTAPSVKVASRRRRFASAKPVESSASSGAVR
jgi:hypothetical protein